MWGNVVDLTRRGHVDQVVGLDLDLVARWQEGVEAHDQVGVTFEELGHSADHPGSVNTEKQGESNKIIMLFYFILKRTKLSVQG